MPIYAYKCESCGFVKDVLQKLSDPVLEVCPSCAKPTFQKQLTAAGFQLKGSGWYVTDFKDGGTAAPSKSETTNEAPATDNASSAPAPTTAATPAAPAAIPAPATPPAPAA